MENHFNYFKKNIIGNDLIFTTPYGKKKMIYADWIASGRLYAPIEDKITNLFGPFVGNTHTETSETGTLMTKAYHYAHELIKKHVNANENDVIITAGPGMTTVINKMQRLLGLRSSTKCESMSERNEEDIPVVFITHMEHHSNQTSWFETNAELVQIEPTRDLLVDMDDLRKKLKQYENRKFKIGSFTACSNVTGIEIPYRELAKIMHENGGVCFIDFAASAPYVDMDMHPKDPLEKLDCVFFSPHKFLGGPGSSGVMIFDSSLYHCDVPDNPGGGTVDWTNPWGEYKYIDDIEIREDGGTPGFLQAIRTALCLEVKNQMGVENIRKKEAELVKIAFKELRKIPNLKILADNSEERLGIISFFIENIHFNLIVKILNDRFGIQVRGGCACAGTYGHYLLDLSFDQSHEISELVISGDLSQKPGWIRISLHPTMTIDEAYFIFDAIKQIAENSEEWRKDYIYNIHNNEYRHVNEPIDKTEKIMGWFKF